MGYAPGKTIVGLEIEPGYVAAVEARAGQVAIERAAAAPLPPGVVRDGEVVDIETLAAVLRQLFTDNKLGRRVRIGVANQRIVMRMLELPPLQDQKEIETAVRFQAQDQIPMPLDQAVLEHQSLGIVDTADGPRTRVVLVAARRDMIEKLLEATRKAGLRPHGVDLSAFAMIRALHRPGSEATVLYLSVGGMTNLAVAVGTTCDFTRVLTQGTGSMAGELAERRALTLEHSYGWLRHVGLLTPIDDVEGDHDIVLDTRNVLAEGVRRIADDVRNSLDFHTMQEGAAGVERVVLTGYGASIPGFADHLSQDVGLPVDVGSAVEAKAGALGGIEAGRLAVAAGLTLDEVPA